MSPFTRRHRAHPHEIPKPAKESSFQTRVNRVATVNGWRVDPSDFHPDHRDETFFSELEAVAPRGKVRALLDFVFGRRHHIFSFGYHTWNSQNSQPGFFDAVYIHPRSGTMLMVELKKDNTYQTKEQRLWFAAAKCVERRSNGAVLIRCWRPRDWNEIVTTLGGKDPYNP